MVLIPPPYQVQSKNKLKIALAVLAAFTCSTTQAAVGEIIDNDYLANDGSEDAFRTTVTQDQTFSGINLVDFTPPSRQNQYAILVQNGATLVIDGNTFIDSKTTEVGGSAEGTLAITAGNSYLNQSGHIQLLRDVEIYMQQLGTTSQYGANAIYSTYDVGREKWTSRNG